MELEYTTYINAAPKKVREALLAGAPIVQAMPGVELRATFEPHSAYAYVGKKDGKEMTFIEGTIIASNETSLEMTYKAGGAPHESHIVYTFEPMGSAATKMSVKQDRFTDGDPNMEANREGWPKLISNLKSFIETGKVMNYYG